MDDDSLSLPSLSHATVTTLVLALLLVAVFWFWFNWQFQPAISAASTLPTLTPTWPLVGHLYLLLHGHKVFSTAIIKLLQQAGEKRLKNCSFWIGPFPILVIGEADDIQTVVTSRKCKKSIHYEFFKLGLGNGLFTAPDDIHKITRKQLNPLFSPRNLEQLSPMLSESGCHLVRDLSEHVGRGHVDVIPIVAPVILKAICDLAFGANNCVNEKSQEFRQFLNNIESIAEVLTQRFFKPWLWSDTVFAFLYRRESNAYLESWMRFSEAPVKELRNKRKVDEKHNMVKNTTIETNEPPPYLTLPEAYDELRENYPQFTEQDMLDELQTLVVTGTHTAKVLVASLMLALAAHPEMQERVYQEVVSVVGAEDCDVTTEDLYRMPYLEQVFKETMRRFAINAVLLRDSKEEIQLREMIVPAGTTMAVSLMIQHFDADVFPEPYTFDPGRFSAENMATMKKNAFTPFSSGYRNCIGYLYATTMVKTIVVQVIRRYRLSSSVDINSLKFSMSVTSYSSNGYRMELHHRDSAEK